jgi:uncharacterized protein YprB with RNaseH-like and TPR domain
MLRDNLIRRIQALNKAPLKNVPDPKPDEPPDIKGLRRKLGKVASKHNRQLEREPATPVHRSQPIIHSRDVRVSTAHPTSVAESDLGPPVGLDDAVGGLFVQAPMGPGYYLIELPAHTLEADSADVHRRFVSLTGHPDGRAVKRLAAVCGAERIAPDDLLFLDIETTGLGGTPLFLIGTMECFAQEFRFRQYLARDYSEEMSVIAAVSERLAETALLVTFNGKSFDLPYIENRATATGVRLHYPESHLDILPEARRVYRRDLPNCRLQTLEQMICGKHREDDIPSAEIPAAYHEFVRTGNANKIRLILQHNLRDLLTMADLMHRMWGRE